MIQRVETARRPEASASTSIWGLRPEEVHDAFWRAHGVQCIRRGRPVELQAADLFLLVEPDQLVVFDLPELAPRLAWRAARVTRLRVVSTDDADYGEHVEVDREGRVTRIVRRYRPRTRAAYRVMLVRDRRLARLWMDEAPRREIWRRVRQRAGWSHVDNLRCPGDCFSAGDTADEVRLVEAIVARWTTPDQAIEGITEVAPQVWSVPGMERNGETVTVGRVWLGCRPDPAAADYLIGPTFRPDGGPGASDSSPVRVRDILEIDPADVERPGRVRRGPGRFYPYAKRTLDVVVSALGLLAAAPLMLLISLCIVLADGTPVLYGHRRQTRGGGVFRCWKFRTMRRDAETMKVDLAGRNQCDGPQFYIEDDPRVTPVGRVLRRWHLDELPQLWNVLIGQMSLVGPRPSPDQENQYCPPWREARLSVRPGITGLWQLERTRQPGADFQEWIRFDMEYVDRAGFWLDIKILARTFWNVFARRVGHAPDETR